MGIEPMSPTQLLATHVVSAGMLPLYTNGTGGLVIKSHLVISESRRVVDYILFLYTVVQHKIGRAFVRQCS